MTKHKFPKTLFSAIVVGCMFLGSTSLFAQVKIGTNPTTINPANNLEVEAATTGRKTSVNKTTGQVTIADGTEGNGRMLTSDAVGGASWKEPLTGTMLNGTTAPAVNLPGFSQTQMVYSGASITFPKPGTYIVYAKWTIFNPATNYSASDPGHCFINTCLSTSTSTNTQTSISAQWVYVSHGTTNSVPSFRVTATAGQTFYFWYYTGFVTGQVSMDDTYALGPF
ncbi:hypothetical protein [Dyadobacter diqingensis]|uniref:hypothetical protein n=1 Tax=Dyadobacter diqingensis TaxID=2938121 RepID=UPI0020C1AEA4|nr:hypothetical protein [Dyadobacter diqingensis]